MPDPHMDPIEDDPSGPPVGGAQTAVLAWLAARSVDPVAAALLVQAARDRDLASTRATVNERAACTRAFLAAWRAVVAGAAAAEDMDAELVAMLRSDAS